MKIPNLYKTNLHVEFNAKISYIIVVYQFWMNDISIFSWESPSKFEMAALSLRNGARHIQKIYQMSENETF
jgi:hypothetical protein